MRRKIIIIILGLVVIAILSFLLLKETTPPEVKTPPPELATISEVIDGITVRLKSGQRVRYLGVYTPDLAGKKRCFAKEAIAANKNIIGKKIRLEEDPALKKSQDGAWIRYAYLQLDPKAEKEKDRELLINEKILEGGFGFPLLSEAMIKWKSMMSAAKYARAVKRGLWDKCKVERDKKTKRLETNPLKS